MNPIDLPDSVNTVDSDQGKTVSKTDLTDLLSRLVKNFELSENMTREARLLSERDKDYYHNIQYTAEELAIYRKRKQPPLTINKIKGKVETMLGLERRMRSNPMAYPRNPDDEDGANAVTDALQYIGEQNDFDEKRSNVYQDMTVSAYGGCDVILAPTKSDPSRIKIEQVPFERLGYDPYSIAADFNDAAWKFIVIWKDKDDAIDEFPGKDAAVSDTLLSSTADGGGYQDTPRDSLWVDSKRTRIRIVQMHYREDGDWWVATFTRGGFLVDPVVSPYLDKDGNTCCSLLMRSMYTDRDGNRYGAVRDLISLQDEFNKRRSKALHLLNSRQTYANQRGVRDIQKFKTELAKPDGHVEINADAKQGEDFGILPTGDMASGQMELLAQVTNEFQAYGANAALAGTDKRDQSGRAQQIQQQAGQVTLEPGMDGLRIWTRAVYEACWMRVKQYWDDEKWIRVTDDERNLKWVGLNKKVTLQDKLESMFGLPMREWTQQNMQQAQQLAGIQSPYDPQLKQVVEVQNDVSGLDVDITIEEAPDLSSVQSEQFETLAGLAKNGVAIPPKALVQASSLRNKDVILDEMEKGTAPSAEIQKQLGDMQSQIKDLTAQLEQAHQKAQGDALKLDDKGDKSEIDAYQAETARISALAPMLALDPQSIQPLIHQLVTEALATHLETLSLPQAPESGLPSGPLDGSFTPPADPGQQQQMLEPQAPQGAPPDMGAPQPGPSGPAVAG